MRFVELDEVRTRVPNPDLDAASSPGRGTDVSEVYSCY